MSPAASPRTISPEENLTVLSGGIAAIVDILSAEEARRDAGFVAWDDFEHALDAADAALPLRQLVVNFGLSRFEVQCVVLALTAHIEPRMHQVVGQRAADLFSRAVTIRLAVECFCVTTRDRVAARSSFLPSAPLIRHSLITLGESEAGSSHGLLAHRLELTTPTLRFLLAEQELSTPVARMTRLERPNVSLFNVILPPLHLDQVRELAEEHARYRRTISAWGFDSVLPYGRGLTLLFSGPSGTGKTLLASAMAAHVKRPLMSLSAADLPDKDGVDQTLRDIFSEALMRDAIVLIDECEALLGKHDRRKAVAFKAIEDYEGILVLTTNHPELLDDALERRIIYHVPFEAPDAALRRQIWEVHLPPEVPLDGDIDLDILADRYDFTGGTIKNAILMAVNRALSQAKDGDAKLTMDLLDYGCRSQLRYALEQLATRTTTHLRLQDIVLPGEAKRKVSEIISAIRNQAVVLNRWGFGERLVTGKGITVLFDGPPGTGKTLCAEIIGGEFGRPIYRVNLPEVVSKWVGETEKHIKQIFQQARISHAMLLFDEADSLFGSRSAETKSATDRYANMEVNLLLQEIERFPGVCILTTNFYGALDRALTRRIQFRVTFEEPDIEQRTKIWQTLCPSKAPLAGDVDFGALAKRYELTGGRIKNALLRAAYLACDGDGMLTQQTLETACADEYKAAGKVARDPAFERRGPSISGVELVGPERPVALPSQQQRGGA